MKSFISILLCCLMVFGTCFSAGAYDTSANTDIQSAQTTVDEDADITYTDRLIIDETSRSSTRTATLERTFEKGDTVIAIIAITAKFSYNGSSVSVLSKSVSRTSTYNGWSFTQNSLTSSGGSVTLSGKLTKFLNAKVPVDMTLSCDKNGNIT